MELLIQKTIEKGRLNVKSIHCFDSNPSILDIWKFVTIIIHLVTAQLPGADGYTGGKIIFIDTENTLYPEYIMLTEHGERISYTVLINTF